MVQAWYYNETAEDPRALHQFTPNQKVSLDQLKKLGVLYWQFNPDTELEKVNELAKERHYANRDEVDISREKLPNYEDKLKIFFTEHLHDDEEIRYILGVYHRFILDETNYLKAMRLFKEDPKWTPFNRSDQSTDNMPVRKSYVASLTEE
ncbi:1,2-dihydroxy-3-keto-5-methylthiopentene dioxygenase [Boothiomyces sp. JEL0866]|nr:1,2-dihydroxy-3-keto-5-methylthiopentene dioxygenase [Boothiomyces sp. JEL0866]